MVTILLNGVFFGVLLSFLIGPVFFVLLETSIKKGVKPAIFIDIGVLLSDILYLIAAYFFAQKILESLNENSYIKYVASAVFIFMGVLSILKKQSPQKGRNIDVEALDTPSEMDTIIFRKRTYLTYILKGIGLNAINPGVLVYWIAACTTATEELHIPEHLLVYYFVATLGTMFGIDVLKIYYASKLKNKLTAKALHRISVVVGCVLIGFGVVIAFKDIS
ncbi:MAG: LysE family translocator [Flavobacteriales bacterium]|nr:LysE family translocator [Flavobacteriales bacterium]